eukprot:jgi/Picsp_1/2634/NSC_00864-R1_hypothetical protein VOLCADRAFT_105929 [Volvox carteri f. nagariensis]
MDFFHQIGYSRLAHGRCSQRGVTGHSGSGQFFQSMFGKRGHGSGNAMVAFTLLWIIILLGANLRWLSMSNPNASEGKSQGRGNGQGLSVERQGKGDSSIEQHQKIGEYKDENIEDSSVRLLSTLVLYVYNAEDEEQERSFAYFLRYGVTEGGPTYRIIITNGPNIKPFPKLPSLPQNAQYLKTSLCTTSWGAIDAVTKVLGIQQYRYFVIVDSHVRGPFVPSYVQNMKYHWTEAFTSRLNNKVKMVGSIISCEGAPKDGNAAGTWRGIPFIISHAWAIDYDALTKLISEKGVFRCHKNKWDTKYYSDAGASLAIFQAGWTIDSLMSRYQGVDWRSSSSWQCNQRVPPDFESHYDGISINPYEIIFVPVKSSTSANRWSFIQQIDRYENWLDAHLRQDDTKMAEIQNNAWISNHWRYKAEKLVSMNVRGPSCFDFEYYLEENPDLARYEWDEMALWEHFLLLGQFQARMHRFECPLQVGNSYRIAYVLSRGARCFDHEYYAQQHSDLERAGFNTQETLFEHFAEFGQFEKRKVRFTCADTFTDIPEGFDYQKGSTRSGVIKGAHSASSNDMERRKAAIQRATMLRERGDANDEVQQALKGALVEEAAKDAFRDGHLTKR